MKESHSLISAWVEVIDLDAIGSDEDPAEYPLGQFYFRQLPQKQDLVNADGKQYVVINALHEVIVERDIDLRTPVYTVRVSPNWLRRP